MGAFKIIEGISLDSERTPDEFYTTGGGSILINPSAQKIAGLFEAAAETLSEPMFFFLELPREGEELLFDTYYLECTRSVAQAIMKRYGELLINDGISRFGFGSHKTDDEICSDTLQRVYVFTKDKDAWLKALDKLRIPKGEGLSAADAFNPETDDLLTVEVNGETVFDVMENLKSAGLYPANE